MYGCLPGFRLLLFLSKPLLFQLHSRLQPVSGSLLRRWLQDRRQFNVIECSMWSIQHSSDCVEQSLIILLVGRSQSTVKPVKESIHFGLLHNDLRLLLIRYSILHIYSNLLSIKRILNCNRYIEWTLGTWEGSHALPRNSTSSRCHLLAIKVGAIGPNGGSRWRREC